MDTLSFSSAANKFLEDEYAVVLNYERHLRWYEKGPDFIRRKSTKMRLSYRISAFSMAAFFTVLGIAAGVGSWEIFGMIFAMGSGSFIYTLIAKEGDSRAEEEVEYNYSMLRDEIENPLSHMRFRAYNVGLGLRGLLRKYNFLVQGEKSGKLDKNQEKLIREVEPIVEGALCHFEECVEVCQWHETAASLSKENKSFLPRLGIDIEELEDARRKLSAATELLAAIDSESSEVACENAENAVVNEISLIELQQGLGNILSLPIVSDPNPTAP